MFWYERTVGDSPTKSKTVKIVMSFLTGKYGFLLLGVVVGATLLSNRVGNLPGLNKIPRL